MRNVIRIFFWGWLLTGCTHDLTPQSETEIRVSEPTIVRATIVDAKGYRLSSYAIPPDPTLKVAQGRIYVRAIATGFTPIKQMLVLLPDGRELPFTQMEKHRFGVDLTPILTPTFAARETSAKGLLKFKVIAIDEKDARTVSDDLRLTLMLPSGRVAH